MTRKEEIRQEAHRKYPYVGGTKGLICEASIPIFIQGAEWADKTMIEKACKCYCDDICDKGRCGMCFHKHDVEGQVKNSFQYNECNELKLIRKAMEEDK